MSGSSTAGNRFWGTTDENLLCHFEWRGHVTRNPNGHTGWARIVESVGGASEVGRDVRVHKCANLPCTARWDNKKYGLQAPPWHVQPAAAGCNPLLSPPIGVDAEVEPAVAAGPPAHDTSAASATEPAAFDALSAVAAAAVSVEQPAFGVSDEVLAQPHVLDADATVVAPAVSEAIDAVTAVSVECPAAAVSVVVAPAVSVVVAPAVAVEDAVAAVAVVVAEPQGVDASTAVAAEVATSPVTTEPALPALPSEPKTAALRASSAAKPAPQSLQPSVPQFVHEVTPEEARAKIQCALMKLGRLIRTPREWVGYSFFALLGLKFKRRPFIWEGNVRVDILESTASRVSDGIVAPCVVDGVACCLQALETGLAEMRPASEEHPLDQCCHFVAARAVGHALDPVQGDSMQSY